MSQREICAYTLLPRQTVNNVINVFASQGLLRLEGSKHDKRVKRMADSNGRCNTSL